MKNYLITLFLTMFQFFGFAQDKNLNYKRSVKLYNLSTYQSITTTTLDSLTSSTYNISSLKILNPTFAYNWKGRNSNFNELELVTLILNSDRTNSAKVSSNISNPQVPAASIITSIISLRYEFIVNLLKGSVSNLVPSIGCGVNPFYQLSNIEPLASPDLPNKMVNFGTRGFLIPRIVYYTNSKCFIDFNIPVELFEFNCTRNKVSNPQIPIESQRTSKWDFVLLPKNFSLRLGVGIKI